MNLINIKEVVGEKNLEDAKWEIDDFAITIIKEYTKDNDSKVYNVNLRRLKEKFDTVITINKDQSKVIGFCPCKEASKFGVCKHMAMSLIMIEEHENKKNNSKNSIQIFCNVAHFDISIITN